MTMLFTEQQRRRLAGPVRIGVRINVYDLIPDKMPSGSGGAGMSGHVSGGAQGAAAAGGGYEAHVGALSSAAKNMMCARVAPFRHAGGPLAGFAPAAGSVGCAHCALLTAQWLLAVPCVRPIGTYVHPTATTRATPTPRVARGARGARPRPHQGASEGARRLGDPLPRCCVPLAQQVSGWAWGAPQRRGALPGRLVGGGALRGQGVCVRWRRNGRLGGLLTGRVRALVR